MKEKRQGSLLRLGLAAALACGMAPAAAFAEPQAPITGGPAPAGGVGRGGGGATPARPSRPRAIRPPLSPLNLPAPPMALPTLAPQSAPAPKPAQRPIPQQRSPGRAPTPPRPALPPARPIPWPEPSWRRTSP